MNDHYDDTGLTRRAWFKPLVALWFGALAAAGMWFMPPSVHASIAGATGLGNIHPMFAQPLGRSGVIALCAAVGVLGALIGFLLAWRIAAANGPRGFAPGFDMHDEAGWAEEEAFEEPRRRRVFSAREDIGEEGIAISAPGGEADYEDEYTIEDIPQASPEEDFETVYAGMEVDYVPPEDEAEPEPESELVEIEAEPDVHTEPDYAEFEDIEELPEEPLADFEPEPQVEPEGESQPLGDMSLDALVGRLGSALDQHRKLVAGSEEAAREPAPRPIPMMREQAPYAEPPAHDGEPEDFSAPDDDPVIAFLRREASRRMPAGEPPHPASEAIEDQGESHTPAPSQTDAQAALRSALDRLGQANRRDS